MRITGDFSRRRGVLEWRPGQEESFLSGPQIILEREVGERRVKDESDLFFRLKRRLQQMGEDVIKKEMSKDGHMVSDHVYYVRSRKVGRPGAYAIYDANYAVRNAAEDFNNGAVNLVVGDMS